MYLLKKRFFFDVIVLLLFLFHFSSCNKETEAKTVGNDADSIPLDSTKDVVMVDDVNEEHIHFDALEKIINSDIESFDSIPSNIIHKLTKIEEGGHFLGKWMIEINGYKLALIRRSLLKCNSDIYVLFTVKGDFLDMEETLIWCSTDERATKFYSKVLFSSAGDQLQIIKLDTSETVTHPDMAKTIERIILNIKEPGLFERQHSNKQASFSPEKSANLIEKNMFVGIVAQVYSVY